MNHNYNQKALQLHQDFGGKLNIISKVKLDNKENLSIFYSPGVGAISLAINESKTEIEKEKLARKFTLKRNTVAIISDGSAILGLGNLGSYSALPVMEGKAAILKEFADVDAFPICLNTQNTEEIINIIKNISSSFGGINLEDIAAPRCFEIENRLKEELNIPIMHDDQWGAATVTLAAIINSLKLLNTNQNIFTKNIENIKIVINGVGAAGVATGKLLSQYGFKSLIYVDSKGIINKNRIDLNNEKITLLKDSNIQDLQGELEDAILGADIFIGLSKANIVTKSMIKSMNKYPIIFALANPIPEIMPEDAKEAGAYIIATGRSDYPNQINNSLMFPGFWRGMLDYQYECDKKGIVPSKYNNNIFVKIAKAIADNVKDLNTENILPDMFDKEIVHIISNIIKDNNK